ncbi:MAG TPA: NAD-dependent epimerase/dehydratase family protein [Hyphomicrobiaceae bacterium]|jgi:NAD dependent epimerase/dehydratase family enzyme|nr:NAD-dependent epimerase/dehydratase family protein [Hyphomicrobiaceae bacterium]
MTILITGATGLIGRPLTQALLDQGQQVRVITRRPHRVLEAFERFSSRVQAFEWHPRSEPFPPEALQGVERVIHLMGEPIYGPATHAARQRIAESRRTAAKGLGEALGRQKVHLIVASSVSVYGFAPGAKDAQPLTESSAVRRPKDKLALALRAAEEAAEQIGANGSTVTAVRLGQVIGPGGFIEPLRRLHAAGFTWRAPPQEAPNPTLIPAIGLGDAVALFAWLARARRVAGPVHAVAPEPLLSRDLKELLDEAAPGPLGLRMALPRLALRRRIGFLADVVHNRQHIVPQRLMEAGFEFERPNPLDSVHAVLAEQAEAEAEARAARKKRLSLHAGGPQKG